MNIERKAWQVFVAGRSGCGKTSYAERTIIGTHHDRIFIYDHQSEFWRRLNLIPVTDFDGLYERVKKERIICFDYSFAYFGEMEERFVEFCDVCFNLCKDCLEPQHVESLFVCDEIQKVVTGHDIPKEFKNISQTGRKFALDTLLLSQQPNEVHNGIRNQATEMVCFAQKDENALKFVTQNGFDPEEIRALQPLNYIWQDMNTAEFRRGTIDYPQKKTLAG